MMREIFGPPSSAREAPLFLNRFQYLLDPNRFSRLLALVRGHHERKNFDGFFRLNRCNPGLEEFHDLLNQRDVAIERTRNRIAALPGGFTMKRVVLAKDPFSSSAPCADDLDFSVRRLISLGCLASGPEDSKQGLDPVNAVPEKVRVMRFQFARSGGFGVADVPDGTIMNRHGVFAE